MAFRGFNKQFPRETIEASSDLSAPCFRVSVLEKGQSRGDPYWLLGGCHSVTNDGEFRLLCDGSLHGDHTCCCPRGREKEKREGKGRLVRGSALIVHRLAQDRLEDKWGSIGWKARLLLNVAS